MSPYGEQSQTFLVSNVGALFDSQIEVSIRFIKIVTLIRSYTNIHIYVISTDKSVLPDEAKKLLASHSTGSIGYYLCLIIQTQFQLGRYIHACTNETPSLTNLLDLIPSLSYNYASQIC